ncbi:hypothetical protein CEQ90_04315 [Lewinellaceae bacterium SD302]|nr:hypothetical protein CEQ90_04315 [Lewinellaceae bacterium SD302]
MSTATLLVNAQQTSFTDIRPKQNSPLSRFGLGDPLDQHFAAQAGMGGLQAVYQDRYQLNVLNPASLAVLQTTSFDVGLYGRVGTLSDANESAGTESGNLSYLALGFPLRNPINLNLDRQSNSWNAGMAFSLAPTTLVGYDLELEDDDPDLGTTSNLLRGNGGTYRVTWSTAYRRKALSVGLNVNYNFGQLLNSRVVVFDSIGNALATELEEKTSISGFSIGYGVQYSYFFKSRNDKGEMTSNGKRLIVGVNGKLQSNVSATSDILRRRFSPSGVIFVSDTLRNDVDVEGELTLPSEINFGLAYEEVDRLFVGLEYGVGNWSNFQINGDADPELVNTNRLAFGIQYIPDATSYNRFFKRVRYRAGLRLENDSRQVNGEQARRNVVTLGVGLPIVLPRQQVSFLNFAVEMGKFGVPNVIDENYVQFTLGFSLNDNTWFYKRKFN